MQTLCPQKRSDEKSFSGKLICHHFFQKLIECFSTNCQLFNCFSIVLLKLLSTYIYEGSELEKNENFIIFLLFGFWDNFSRFFSKLCRWCCQNWMLHPQRSALWKIFFEKITIFYHCRTLKEKRLDFVKTLLAWMSKLHPKCPYNFFEKKDHCWNIS